MAAGGDDPAAILMRMLAEGLGRDDGGQGRRVRSHNVDTITQGFARPAHMGDGTVPDPLHQLLPYAEPTVESLEWSAKYTASSVTKRRQMSRSGGFGALIGHRLYAPSFVAEGLVVLAEEDVDVGRGADRFIAYLVANFAIIRKSRAGWSLTAQATYCAYLTALSFRTIDDGVAELRGQFTAKAPGKWTGDMAAAAGALGVAPADVEEPDLLAGINLTPEINDAARAMALVIINHAVLVATHVGTTTGARIAKFNSALETQGMQKVTCVPEMVQEAWSVTRPIALNGDHDYIMISLVSGMWNGLSEVSMNFLRQSVWRTLGPLMVTGRLMATFRSVGWARLLGMCPGECTGMTVALQAMSVHGDRVIYNRPDCLAQSNYRRVALAAVLVGQGMFPTLQNLNGKFRSAPLSPAIRHWIRDNRELLNNEESRRVPVEELRELTDLVQQIGSITGME